MPDFYVKACWDAEAAVFYSEIDIPGLTVDAPTLAGFQQLILACPARRAGIPRTPS